MLSACFAHDHLNGLSASTRLPSRAIHASLKNHRLSRTISATTSSHNILTTPPTHCLLHNGGLRGTHGLNNAHLQGNGSLSQRNEKPCPHSNLKSIPCWDWAKNSSQIHNCNFIPFTKRITAPLDSFHDCLPFFWTLFSTHLFADLTFQHQGQKHYV